MTIGGGPPNPNRAWVRQIGTLAHISAGDDGEIWGITSDDGVRQPSFALPPALAAHPVRWRVVHQRVAQHSSDPRRAPVEGEVEFASGVLAPP